MIPYILAAVGGYLLGQSHKEKYADGGMMAKGDMDYYDDLRVYVQGVGTIYQGNSLSEATDVFDEYYANNPHAEMVMVDEKYGDEIKWANTSSTDDEEEEYAKGGKVKSKKWIQDALSGGKNKGALRRTAAKKGLLRGDENLSKTDLKKLQKMGGTTAKRAHLAETLRKFDEGGDV